LNNIQVTKNSFVAVPSLLSPSCNTATSSSVIIPVTVSMYALKELTHVLMPLKKLMPWQHYFMQIEQSNSFVKQSLWSCSEEWCHTEHL